MSVKVNGYCPMGCGEYLVLLGDGRIKCLHRDCPDPFVVTKVILDPETEHMVVITEQSFAVTHPLRERLSDMTECDLHQQLHALSGPPVAEGRYRALRSDVSREPLRGWSFERVR